MKTTAIVIGAGISGLSAAYGLQKKGFDVSVLEPDQDVGGALKTVQRDGYLAERGPNSMQITSPEMAYLLGELGLRTHIVTPQPGATKRFLVKHSQLLAAPMGPIDFLKTPLLSPRAKFKLMCEPWIKKTRDADDASLAHFTARRLGHEVLDYAVNPMISGIYAGKPEALSTKHALPKLWDMEQQHGSLLKGALAIRKQKRQQGQVPFKPFLASFKHGMHTLAHAFQQKLGDAVQLNAAVTQIAFDAHADQPWIVHWHENDTEHKATSAYLILALPAHAIPALPLPASIRDTLYDLPEIPYPALASLVLGFKRDHIQHPLNGFGMLIPEKEHKNILGVLFSSSLFGGRAPEGHHTLTVFMGGARQETLAGLPQAELLDLALKDLNRLLGLSGKPTFIEHTFWKHAIPQYNLGYGRFVEMMERAESRFSGLKIIGNHRGGISVGNCLMNGLALADALTDEEHVSAG